MFTSIKHRHFLILLICSSISFYSHAASFSTSLESVPDQVDPTLTTTVVNGGLSADFTGGTIDQIGDLSLYFVGLKSWMVAPSGEAIIPQTVLGNGTGTITLSADAFTVRVQGRNQSLNTVAEVRLLDSSDMMIGAPIMLTNSVWTDINVTRIQGDTLIRKVQLIVSSGTGMGMAALDNLCFQTTISTPSACSGSGSSGGSTGGSSGGAANIYLLQLMIALLLTIRKNITKKINNCAE